MHAQTYIVKTYPMLGRVAIVSAGAALSGFSLAFVISTFFPAIPLWLEYAIASLLGFVLVSGLYLMFAVTWIVVMNRERISSFRRFLAVTWMIPYIGVLLYLGPIALKVECRHQRVD